MYPNGITLLPDETRPKQHGSLENYFASLSEQQKELADKDTIDLLNQMF